MSYITQFLPENFCSCLCLKNYAKVTIRFPRLQFYVTQNIVLQIPPRGKPWNFISEFLWTFQYLFLDWLFYLRSDSTQYLIEMKEQDFKIGHELFLLYPIELFRTFTYRLLQSKIYRSSHTHLALLAQVVCNEMKAFWKVFKGKGEP